VHVLEGQAVKKGQLLLELDVKDAAALLATGRNQDCCRRRMILRAAQGGGRSDAAAKASGDLAKAIAEHGPSQTESRCSATANRAASCDEDELAANEWS